MPPGFLRAPHRTKKTRNRSHAMKYLSSPFNAGTKTNFESYTVKHSCGLLREGAQHPVLCNSGIDLNALKFMILWFNGLKL